MLSKRLSLPIFGPLRPIGIALAIAIAGLVLGIAYATNPTIAVFGGVGILGVAFAVVFPEAVAWLALMSVALSPQYFIEREVFGFEVSSLHKVVLLVMLIPYIVKHGFRDKYNLIIIAYTIVLLQTFTLSTWPPQLTTFQVFKSYLGLITGWIIFSLVWKKRQADKYLLTLSLMAVISVIVGIILHVLSIHPLYIREFTGAFRLQGANIPPHLAMLAFIGVIAAMGEVNRGNQKFFLIALINLGILVATGTRGATLGAICVCVPFTIQQIRRFWVGRLSILVIGIIFLSAVVLAVAWPNFRTRLTVIDQTGERLNTSGRLEAWKFFLDEAMVNPWFGRGIGAGTVLNQGQVHRAFRVPHNEYIRMFDDGGIVGTIILLLGFTLVFRKLLIHINRKARFYLSFVIAGFMIYSIFDNTLSTTQFAVPFGWFLAIFASKERADAPS